MEIRQIVFSPTGGTQKAADCLAAQWGGEAMLVDLCEAELDFSAVQVSRDELALIALPSYMGRVPALAAERLSKIRGEQTPCVLLCVYGNRAYDDTLAELYDLAERSGFRVVAAVAAVAEHSIVHRYAQGRPDSEDEVQLRDFAKKIREKIEGGSATAPKVPGTIPDKKPAGKGLVPKAGKKCTACGLCAEKCPAQAIDRADPRVTDGKKCISCMRCVALCPHSAREVNGALVSATALAIKKACAERKSNELFI